MSNDGISIVLYPRSYNKRGDVSLHSVEGVTADGILINVKLRVDHFKPDDDWVPSISEFSRIDRRATQACVAVETNSVEDREGVLLFTRAYLEGNNRKGVPSYVAKWASVLSPDADSPTPIFEIGRMEIVKSSPAINSLKQVYLAAKNLGNIYEMENIEKKLRNPENYLFRSVFYKYSDLFSISYDKIDIMRSKIFNHISNFCRPGYAGGFLIRMVNKNGYVVYNSYLEVCAQYNFMSRSYEKFEDFFDRFTDDYGKIYFSEHEFQIDVMPIYKILCSIKDNSYYAREKNYSFIESTFYSDEDPVVSKVAAKINGFDQDGNYSVSRLNLISSLAGHPARLDAFGSFSLPFEGENRTYSQNIISNDDLIEAPIGMARGRFFSRSFWMFGGLSSIANAAHVDNSASLLNDSVDLDFDKIDILDKSYYEDSGDLLSESDGYISKNSDDKIETIVRDIVVDINVTKPGLTGMAAFVKKNKG